MHPWNRRKARCFCLQYPRCPYSGWSVVALILLIGPVSLALAQSRQTLRGTVREAGSGQALAGVHVSARPGVGTTTHSDGTFSLSLFPSDSLRLTFSFVGYETVVVSYPKTGLLQVQLRPGIALREVVVRSGRERLSEETALSRIALPLDQLRQLPALLGEKDVLKVIQLLPGVQKGSEGNAGVYVRGGGPDQNLILLDEAVVYNPSHLFGFFSVFNGDVLKGVSLTKGGFPAQYGGRLSSVIDITTKEGNRERLRGEGSVGLIASRLTLDGPLGHRASFLVSGRYSYYGLITKQVMAAPTQGDFYDLNAKLSLDLSRRDQLSLSAYTGHDQFVGSRGSAATSLKTGLSWGNTTASLRWKHLFSEKLFANTALLFSGYGLKVSNQDAISLPDNGTQVVQLDYVSTVRDLTFKTDFEGFVSPRHRLRMGGQTTLHRFRPSAVVGAAAQAGTNFGAQPEITSLESGIYAEDEWKLGDRLRLNTGLRLSHYNQHRTNFLRPEPRLSLAYVLPRAWALKGSYAKMNQYVHLLSNTGTGLPTDLWVPSTDRLQPQQSEQIAVGMAKDFLKKTGESTGLSLTVEGYAKTMTNLISYREGASFLIPTGSVAGASRRWEDDVTAGRGQSYGAEVLLQKKRGRLTGWAGYTLSRTTWQFTELNNGQPFHPRHDRRHDVSLVGIYEVTPRIRVSGTWVYGSGQALTVPVARYKATLNNAASGGFGASMNEREYSGKNGFRGEAYHRLDLSLQFIRPRAGRERIWELSVYNAYNRRNPFFYALEGKTDAATKTTRTVFYRYSLFAAIPSVSYSVKF
ncbi:MAG: TonB-dependent receptor [Sphingobacteriaceae bacterium]|nr:TonB-dependent receptor [Cytophagaceae bacterium]